MQNSGDGSRNREHDGSVMKPSLRLPVLAAVFALPLTIPLSLSAQEKAAAKKPPVKEKPAKPAEGKEKKQEAAEPKEAGAEETKLDANELLERATKTMGSMTSYHAAGTITVGKAKATLTGDFGVGMVDMVVKGFDGKTTHRRAVKSGFWISEDAGKTWKEDPAKEMTVTLSSIVTAPIGEDMKPWEQGAFKIIGEEKVGEEDVLHIQKPAEGEAAAMDFWLAAVEGTGLVIRKASLIVAATDGDFPVVFTYTKLNEAVEIEAPESAGKEEKSEEEK